MPDKSRKKTVRKARFEFVVTQEEREALEAQAVARGLTGAAFVRTLILGAPLPDRKTGIEAETVAALNRIGSNINQIAKVGNSSGSLTTDQINALAGHLKRLSGLRSQIQEHVA